ncbi:MAG: hypothetical protein CMB80_25940 [Flammeovirgaceae bacterium]|nr:hypothetical protein [Flammeovirgaceae bacterium]|tara:strand:+ start:461 stop:790 length:330 start_codon:yes stop_codon:yes gene_type:complete
MSNSLYYGEIAAKLSAHLFQNPDQVVQLDLIMNEEEKGDTVWSICADAARVFDSLEDLSGEHFIDWHKALELYADEMLDFIMQGNIPNILDLMTMAVRCIQSACELTCH